MSFCLKKKNELHYKQKHCIKTYLNCNEKIIIDCFGVRCY